MAMILIEHLINEHRRSNHVFQKKKKTYKVADKYALMTVQSIKESDKKAGYVRPAEYYECRRKLLSKKYRRYKQEDFEKDVERIGHGHYEKELKEVSFETFKV